jgi:capping protein (actin filament) muscle Z-line, alpha
LVVCITASKFNESNLWSGRWRSVYRVAFQEEKKVKVSGTMKVNVHYYEKGNIQLNTSKEYGETISGKDDVFADIVAAISKVEGAFQKDIDTACNNLTETFKGLRRRLPINGTLFNFGATGQHNLVDNMTKGKKN